MAGNSPYDTAVAAVPGLTNSWFFRDLATTTATATTGAVNGTYTGGYGQGVVSPLARDSSTPTSPEVDVVAGVRLGSAAQSLLTPTLGYVNFGNNFANAALAPFAITALVRLRPDVPSGYTWAVQEVFDKSTAASRTGWDLAIDANRYPMLRRWNAGSADTCTSTTALTPGLWYWLGASFDGAVYRTYVDDGPVGMLAPTAPVSLGTNAANALAGARSDASGLGVDGDIGPIALYNRALAQEEMAALFTAAFVPTPRTFYVNSSTGNDTYDGTSATFVSGSTGPWKTFYKAASTVQAGDTAVFAYNNGTPYVETQIRPYSAMAYSGTKRRPITFTSDQTAISGRVPTSADHLPIIQFGTISTGTTVGTITAASWSGGVATYTVASHTLVAGKSWVTVTGASPSGWNVADAIVTAISGATFSVRMPSNPGAWTSGGTATTGVDLTGQLKLLVLQQCWHVITQLEFNQPITGSDWADRLVSFFAMEHQTGVAATTALAGDGTTMTITTGSAHGLGVGQMVHIVNAVPSTYNGTYLPILTVPSSTTFTVPGAGTGTQTTAGWITVGAQQEVQTVSVTAGATGTFTITFPGNTATSALSVTATAAQVQAALRATASTPVPGTAGPMTNVWCVGGPLGTAAVTVVPQGGPSYPFANGPLSLLTVTQPTTGTASTARTTAGGNFKRWYQAADFCTLSYCRLRNAYNPYKSAIDTGSQFVYNTIEGCALGIGCVNSNAPVFANNYFLMNGTGQALRNGGNLVQQDAIQSKGGTRNAQMYGNVVRVPVGATPLTGTGIYVGGSSNELHGVYDTSASGKEGYHSVAYNNVLVGEYADAIAFGIAISGGLNDVVANNVVLNATVAYRAVYGGLFPSTNARPKVDNPTFVNNIMSSPGVVVGQTTAISQSSFTATYTVANTLAVNDMVTVEGAVPAGYNGAALVVASASTTQFTVVLPVSGLAAASVQGLVTKGVGYGFKWGTSQAVDLGTGALTFTNNLRYRMLRPDDAATTNPIANDIGANTRDPQFVDWLTDWHTRPGSPVSQAGTLAARTPYANGYQRAVSFDLLHDYAGYLRSSTPDLGIYAWSVGKEDDAVVGALGVDTVYVDLDDATASTYQRRRQIMVMGDPADRAAVQRIDRDGGAVTRPYALASNLVQGNPAALTTTTPATLFAPAGPNLRTYMTDLTVVNSHATVGTVITIADAGGTIWQGYAAAAGGGVALTFPAPRRQSTANAAITVTAGTTGANVVVSAGGFKAA